MNKNMNILIIGDGFVGKNLNNYFKNTYNVSITNRKILDVNDPVSVEKFFKKANFTHIIYCAGLKDVAKCETNESLAYDTNSNSLVNISKYLTNEKFIYLSTDYVFDGHKGLYKENDTTNPNTIYGKSKLLGETNSLTYFSNPIVVRTSGVYGKGCKWIEWLLTTSDKEISCFIDVYNSPTYVYDLAEMIINVIKQDFRGIVNLAGSDVVNRYELYSEVFKYKKNTITNLTKGTSNNTFPKNISLDVSLYRGIVNKTPMSIEQGLKALFNEN